MKKLFTLQLGLFLLMAAPVYARAATDFSGTWVLDTSRGENLGMVAAIKQTVVITQTPQKMILDVTSSFMGKTNTRRVIYDLGGSSTANETAMGVKSETVASWKDDRLVAVWTSAGAVSGSSVVRTETRWLSEDGRTMTVSTARGNKAPRIMVYDRKQ